MKFFLFLLKQSWKIVVIATSIGALSGVASLGLIALIHHSLRSPEMPGVRAMWLFIGLCVAVLVARVTSQLLLVRMSQGVISRLIRYLTSQILRVPLRKLEEIGAHRLLTTLTTDVQIIANAMNSLPHLCINGAILTCGLVYLAYMSLPLFGAVLVMTIIGVISFRLPVRNARKHLRNAREDQDTLMKHIRGLIDGTKELKLNRPRREAFLAEAVNVADANLRERQTKGQTIQAVAVGWGRLLFFVVIGLMLFLWPRIEPISMNTLAGYTLTLLYLMAPLEGMVAAMPLFFGRARIALNRIDELGLTVREFAEEESFTAGQEFTGDWKQLELAGITHTYKREKDEGDFLLGPIDLVLRPGEIVFVVGGNGSGKTTMMKVLTGLYPPEGGEVRLDGQVIGVAQREAYRQMFSAIFADVVLFDSLFGIKLPQIDEKARTYLEQLHLNKDVTITDGTFSTTEELSKGQRKRLALVAAYLEDRPIYIFDEWAADQDPLFKRVFYTRILPDLKARGKAVLAVTHDDNYFEMADRILVLRDGKAVDGDWRDALIQRGHAAIGAA